MRYGQIVKPKTYQNKNIEGNEDFVTKEIICQQYCLTSLADDSLDLFAEGVAGDHRYRKRRPSQKCQGIGAENGAEDHRLSLIHI